VDETRTVLNVRKLRVVGKTIHVSEFLETRKLKHGSKFTILEIPILCYVNGCISTIVKTHHGHGQVHVFQVHEFTNRKLERPVTEQTECSTLRLDRNADGRRNLVAHVTVRTHDESVSLLWNSCVPRQRLKRPGGKHDIRIHRLALEKVIQNGVRIHGIRVVSLDGEGLEPRLDRNHGHRLQKIFTVCVNVLDTFLMKFRRVNVDVNDPGVRCKVLDALVSDETVCKPTPEHDHEVRLLNNRVSVSVAVDADSTRRARHIDGQVRLDERNLRLFDILEKLWDALTNSTADDDHGTLCLCERHSHRRRLKRQCWWDPRHTSVCVHGLNVQRNGQPHGTLASSHEMPKALFHDVSNVCRVPNLDRVLCDTLDHGDDVSV